MEEYNAGSSIRPTIENSADTSKQLHHGTKHLPSHRYSQHQQTWNVPQTEFRNTLEGSYYGSGRRIETLEESPTASAAELRLDSAFATAMGSISPSGSVHPAGLTPSTEMETKSVGGTAGFVMNVNSPSFRPSPTAASIAPYTVGTTRRLPSRRDPLYDDRLAHDTRGMTTVLHVSRPPSTHGASTTTTESSTMHTTAGTKPPITVTEPSVPSGLSNEAIEAAIHAATSAFASSFSSTASSSSASGSSSSPSTIHNYPGGGAGSHHPGVGGSGVGFEKGRYRRSARSTSDVSGSNSESGEGSGYASEKGQDTDKRPSQGRTGLGAQGTAPGRPGMGDSRSIPPRDTRTLLFVGNLPYRVRWQDLKDLFRRAGTVLRADVSLGPDNRSRGYGTVLLGTAEDAGRAIDLFNGYEWQTRVLEVRVDRVGRIGAGSMGVGYETPGMSGSSGAPGMMGMNVTGYTGGGGMYAGPGPSQPQASFQPFPSQPAPLSQYQQPHAQQHQQIYHTSVTGMNIGVGDPLAHQNFILRPTASVPVTQTSTGTGAPGRTLFVGNLPYHVQWQDLKDLFRRVPSNHLLLQPKPLPNTSSSAVGHTTPPSASGVSGEGNINFNSASPSNAGSAAFPEPQLYLPNIPTSMLTFNILRADVALGPDGRSKGFGTVVFSTQDEAERARRVFNGYEFNGRQLKVHYDRMTATSSGSVSTLSGMQMSVGGHASSMNTSGFMPSSSPSTLAQSNAASLAQQMLGYSTSNVSTHLQNRLAGLSLSSSPSASGSLPSSASPANMTRSPVPHLAHQYTLGASPNLDQMQSLQVPGQARGVAAASISSPTSRSRRLSISEQLMHERLEHIQYLNSQQLDDQLQQQSPLQQHQQQLHIRQPNPNRPTHITLPARSFNVDFDPSLGSVEPLPLAGRYGTRGTDSGGSSGDGYESGASRGALGRYEREVQRTRSGSRSLGKEGHYLGETDQGYGHTSDVYERGFESALQANIRKERERRDRDEVIGIGDEERWELQRKLDRDREQELFQVLQGSRRQQQQQFHSQVSREGPFSTSMSSLLTSGLGGGDATTSGHTTSSAPVSHIHSPSTTFLRTSSSGSGSSSHSSSSSSSQPYQHQYPYQQVTGQRFGKMANDAVPSTRSSSAASIYDPLAKLQEGNDLGMGMVESLLYARRLALGGDDTRAGEGADAQASNRVTGSVTDVEIGTIGEGVSSSGASSAAASTRSLPLWVGMTRFVEKPTTLTVQNRVTEDEYEEEDNAQYRSPRKTSRTGSTTSASESSGGFSFGTSVSGSAISSRTGSTSDPSSSTAPQHAAPLSQSQQKRIKSYSHAARNMAGVGAGSDADISEAEGEEEGDGDSAGRRRREAIGGSQAFPNRSTSESAITAAQAHRSKPSRGRNAGLPSSAGATLQTPEKTDRQHPGPIELPPPPPVVAIASSPQAKRDTSTTEQPIGSLLANGLFQQHHPFASGTKSGSGEADHEHYDYAKFDYSGVPTVQAGPVSSVGSGERRGAEPVWDAEQNHISRQQQQKLINQPASITSPHGLPPITPSMPPFTLVTGSPASHYHSRQNRVQHPVSNRRHPANAPGMLSLPPHVFVPGAPGQLSPQQATPPGHLHPLGSPGSPYALGPHHPLLHHHHHHQHQHFHSHSYPHHPLAQSFAEGVTPPPITLLQAGHFSPVGHPMVSQTFAHPMPPHPGVGVGGPPPGAGLAAMSPGAFWGRPRDMSNHMNPYMNPAVGAPVRLLNHEMLQEPQGYFDQLYTNPSGPTYVPGHSPGNGGPRGATDNTEVASNSTKDGGAGQSTIEWEIMKDRSRLENGKDDSQQQGEESPGDPPLGPVPIVSNSSQATNASDVFSPSLSKASTGTVLTNEEGGYLSDAAQEVASQPVHVKGQSSAPACLPQQLATLQRPKTDPGPTG
ncbi:hypothetical protein FA15DRAFT_72863 [Coprinopsis marcescibilis]|uniref:RRM domain-containing protein n=1 Tax=Coprinopsis marcescibilis TaxID=230819 RepID=A0A5C3KMF1_COPMA|nr:hypothetical protein FA15DRAFT_72863 [Coprinopsis marcescibilis]